MANKLGKTVSRCMSDIARHPVSNVDVYIDEEDMLTWHLALHFPEAAPFTGGPGGSLTACGFPLYVTLFFSENFPAKPPRLKLLSPWTNHQHLWGDRICHSLLTDDFLDYFQERRTHGTSMWNAGCALADKEGLGGMPRYLEILRDYLASDLDYDEEKHVTYDAESLGADVERQRSFVPDFFSTASLLESTVEDAASGATACAPNAAEERGYVQQSLPSAVQDLHWGTDFFSKMPLVVGDAELHPCFDIAVTILPRRAPILSTAMACLCPKSFDAGAHVTDFGSQINVIFPYPCTRPAWNEVGASLAATALDKLSAVAQGYAVKLKSAEGSEDAQQMEAILNVAGELWKTTCISIVKDEGYASERAMMAFVSLHFWLLCEVEKRPSLLEHALATVKELVRLIETEPGKDLKALVPDLGRFLVRFLLTSAELPLQGKGAEAIVRELFSRNVRWVQNVDLWADEESTGEEKELEVKAAFEAGHFGMKLTLFQSYFILRAAELGLDTPAALEACKGRPTEEALRAFQEDCKQIQGLASYAEFFRWLQLEDLAGQDVHPLLYQAVDDSEERGYNAGVPR